MCLVLVLLVRLLRWRRSNLECLAFPGVRWRQANPLLPEGLRHLRDQLVLLRQLNLWLLEGLGHLRGQLVRLALECLVPRVDRWLLEGLGHLRGQLVLLARWILRCLVVQLAQSVLALRIRC